MSELLDIVDDIRPEIHTEISRRILRMALLGEDLEELETEGSDRLYSSLVPLELTVVDFLEEGDRTSDCFRRIAENSFQAHRVVPAPQECTERFYHILRTSCFGVLADRGVDAKQYIETVELPSEDDSEPTDWADHVLRTVTDVWLRLIRKDGWDDLDSVQEQVLSLRNGQDEYEEVYLSERNPPPSGVMRLITLYHLSKAADDLGVYLTQGNIDGDHAAKNRLQAQFDRAHQATNQSGDPDLESLLVLLEHTAYQMVENSIWTVTRAVNSRVSEFVQKLASRESEEGPILEMLPPQRAALREQGLLGSSSRSVVVSLPTSSGKTLIAQFRMLQALNQFDQQNGWIAYVAPTRALVNQVCARLRRSFGPEIRVEKVSPALEVDQMEADLLTNEDEDSQFRILVTTHEKLDLMLRSGWEEEIDRPLTLVVVDEAHNLANGPRGLRLELLLATIDRECQYAQFLLLTPFIRNAGEIAQWLDEQSHKEIQMSLEWKPNDRVIALSRQEKGQDRGSFSLYLETLHTSKDTLSIDDQLTLSEDRPLGLSWSEVSSSHSSLAAATAQVLKSRGSIIILAQRKDWAWSLARRFKVETNYRESVSEDISFVQRYLAAEFGEDFELIELLSYGVAVHHSGLSDEAKRLIEWLFENEGSDLEIVVSTTTIAQGVNFPVSGIVLAQYKYPYGKEMPPTDFWNLAGRAGRVDQARVGTVALAATDNKEARERTKFVDRQVLSLTSTLVEMVQDMRKTLEQRGLSSLFYKPAWSSFLQYIVHSYRQIIQRQDDSDISVEMEQILRNTLGYQKLRKEDPDTATSLLRAVNDYAQSLQGEHRLELVDRTGFSLESIRNAMQNRDMQELSRDSWEDSIFESDDRRLQKMMGVLLDVPELRQNLTDVLGGEVPDGNSLAQMVKDWVNGRSLLDISEEYYLEAEQPSEKERTTALSKCCSRLFGKLSQTTAWGISALQSLSVDDFDELSEDELESLRNLPSYIYYGVDSSDAMKLRLLGVPRTAASSFAKSMGTELSDHSVPEVREWLSETDEAEWEESIGERGGDYYRAWKILEGFEE